MNFPYSQYSHLIPRGGTERNPRLKEDLVPVKIRIAQSSNARWHSGEIDDVDAHALLGYACVYPRLDDDLGQVICVSSQYDDVMDPEPYLTIMADDNTFFLRWNTSQAISEYLKCAEYMSLEQWKKAQVCSLEETLSIDLCGSPTRWIQTMAYLCLPEFDGADAEAIAHTQKRSFLQRLCLGAQLHVAPSPLKLDYAAALVAARDRSNDELGVVYKYDDTNLITQPISHVACVAPLDVSKRQDYFLCMRRLSPGGTWEPVIESKDCDSLSLEGSGTIEEWTFVHENTPGLPLKEETVFDAIDVVAKKFENIAPEDCLTLRQSLTYAQKTVKRHTATLIRSASSAKEQIERLQRQESEMASVIAACRNVTHAPAESGCEEVVGVSKTFAKYNSADAPKPIERYSLSFWKASQRCGRSGETVDFDADDLIDAILGERVISLVGPPGVGKTSVVRQIGAILGVPVSIVQFTRDKPIEQLVGVDRIVAGEQVFCDGEIAVALRRAASNPDIPHIVVLDEFDHADAGIQSDFHGICEGREYVLPNGETIPVLNNIHFVLTRNTGGHGDITGRHTAANVSDSAFTSRVSCTFNVTYMKEVDEAALLITHGLSPEEASQIVTFANASRQSVSETDSGSSFDGMTEPICLRHLLSYTGARMRGMEKDKALAACIIGSLPERDQPVANELAITHVGSK